jgi:hypothetical protein
VPGAAATRFGPKVVIVTDTDSVTIDMHNALCHARRECLLRARAVTGRSHHLFPCLDDGICWLALGGLSSLYR